MKHVIVTGGAGFVGSHLCDALLSRGYAVTAVDNLCTGREANIAEAKRSPHFQFVNKDVSRTWDDSEIPFLSKHGLHGLFHFACPASPVDFDRIPFTILEVDSLGTIHTVDLALRYGARYVVASTSEIYGDPLEHPQKEDYWGNCNTLGPRSCYDEAKRFAEAYVSTAMRGTGTYRGKPAKPLNAGIVRIFNTYGPRMRPDDGRLVPEFCIRALKGQPLTVHGDGRQTRSFCFVSDLVDGICRLFESNHKEAFNIGNPIEHTVLEFATIINELSGSHSPVTHLPAREDDPRKRCPDISKARSKLGWEPKVSLEEGLRRLMDYFRGEMV